MDLQRTHGTNHEANPIDWSQYFVRTGTVRRHGDTQKSAPGDQ